MTYGELKIYDRFGIEKEPDSTFIKEENRYDGAVNAHQLKGKSKGKMFVPVIISKDCEVVKL